MKSLSQHINESFVNEANDWGFKVGDTVNVLYGQKATKAKILRLNQEKDSADIELSIESDSKGRTYPMNEIFPKQYKTEMIKSALSKL